MLTEAFVEMQGYAFRASLEDLLPLLASDPQLRTELVQYFHSLTNDFLQTTVSAACGTLLQRAARWLLLAETCSGSSQLILTHEHLSQILAVRRSGITQALHVLEGLGAIRSDRASVTIVDRKRLQDAAKMPSLTLAGAVKP